MGGQLGKPTKLDAIILKRNKFYINKRGPYLELDWGKFRQLKSLGRSKRYKVLVKKLKRLKKPLRAEDINPKAEKLLIPLIIFSFIALSWPGSQRITLADPIAPVLLTQFKPKAVIPEPKTEPQPIAEPVAPPAPAPEPVPEPAPAPPPVVSYSGSHEDWMSAAGISSSDYGFVDYIVSHEGGWRVDAYNPSGAYGLCQSLPGSKMASAGADWETNPVTQLIWCNSYAQAKGGWYTSYLGWLQNHWW